MTNDEFRMTGKITVLQCMLLASGFLPFLLLLRFELCLAENHPLAKLDTGATAVWDTSARDRTSEFIIRIARYSPDRHFEWESRAHQGTIRIPRHILKEGKKITFARLFDNGVDIDRTDFLTLWLSEKIYEELKTVKRSRITMDSLKDEFVLLETFQYPLIVDKQAVTVSALKLKDDRGATWIYLDSAENPIMLEYKNKYYEQKIRYLTTRGNILRWIH